MGNDVTKKILGQIKGPLKPSPHPSDSLFSSTEPAPQTTLAEAKMEEAPIYSQRVTLPLSTQQRDLLDDLAKRLQRQRPERAHDFTRSSIIRAFISLLNEDSFKDARVSTESQLVEYMRNKFLK